MASQEDQRATHLREQQMALLYGHPSGQPGGVHVLTSNPMRGEGPPAGPSGGGAGGGGSPTLAKQQSYLTSQTVGASVALAEARMRRLQTREADGNVYPWTIGMKRIGQVLGAGVAHWLRELHIFSGMLAPVLIVSLLPVIIFTKALSDSGDGSQLEGSTKTSLAAAKLTSSNVDGYDPRTVSLACAGADALCCVLVLIALGWLRVTRAGVTEHAEDSAITLDDYSVRLHGLPRDVVEDEVYEYCTPRFGAVHEVVVVEDFTEVLTNRKRLVKLLENMEELKEMIVERQGLPEIKSLNKKMKKLSDKKEDLELIIAEAMHADEARILEVFVVFEDEISALRCRARLASKWFQPQRYRFTRGKKMWRVKARQPAAPSQVLWENMGIRTMDRLKRKVVSLAFTLALLGASTLAVGYVNNEVNALPPKVDCSSVERGVGQNLVCEDIWYLRSTMKNTDVSRISVASYVANAPSPDVCREYVQQREFVEDMSKFAPYRYASFNTTLFDQNGVWLGGFVPDSQVDECAAVACYSCYCRYRGAAAYGKDVDGLKEFCHPYWREEILFTTYTTVALVTTVVINVALKVAMRKLANFEKAHSITARDLALATKLAAALFVNSAVLPLLMYADIPALSSVPFFFKGAYKDLTVEWHVVVESTVFTTGLVNAISFPLAHYAQVLFWRMRMRSVSTQKKTQRQLDRVFSPPDYRLDVRYGQYISVLCFTMLYASGVPLLWPLFCIYCLLQYTIDRELLLEHCRTPPRYIDELTKLVQGIAPWAALMHCLFAVWNFGNAELPSYEVIVSEIESVRDHSEESGWLPKEYNVFDRLRRANSLVPFALAFLIFASLAVDFFLRFSDRIISFITCSGERFTKQNLPSVSDAKAKGKLLGLTSYKMECNPKYKELFPEAGLARGFSNLRQAKRQSVYASDVPNMSEIMHEAPATDSAPGDAQLLQYLNEQFDSTIEEVSRIYGEVQLSKERMEGVVGEVNALRVQLGKQTIRQKPPPELDQSLFMTPPVGAGEEVMRAHLDMARQGLEQVETMHEEQDAAQEALRGEVARLRDEVEHRKREAARPKPQLPPELAHLLQPDSALGIVFDGTYEDHSAYSKR